MVASLFAKIPVPIGAFFLKLGILALGIGWISLAGWPSSQELVGSDGVVNPSPGIAELSSAGSSLPTMSHAFSPESTVSAFKDKTLSARMAKVDAEKSVLNVQALLDVNDASQEDLERLPGLGTLLAERIVAYRQTNGPFRHVEELERVRGIGRKRLLQLRPLITVKSGKV